MIATRNRPQLLRAALDHVTRQTGIDAEVLVVDDNSDYDATSLVGSYRERLNVRALRLTSTHGCAAARNVGFLESSADLVIQLDDDSWLIEDDAARKIVDYLRENPGVGALAIRVFQPWKGSATGVGEVFERWDRPHLATEYSFHGCAAAFRREIVLRAGMYPAIYTYGGQEDHLAARILQLGSAIRFFGDRGVVHGYDTLVEDPKPPEAVIRNRIYSTSHIATTLLALLPFPLNYALAGARIASAVGRGATPLNATIARIRVARRHVPRTPMTWRQAIAYLRLRHSVRRRTM